MPQAAKLWTQLAASQADDKLAQMLTFYLSPVLKKVKAAELVVLKNGSLLQSWRQEKNLLANILGLKYYQLHSCFESTALIFYQQELLTQHLSENVSQQILKQNAYHSTKCLETLLAQLAKRMQYKKIPHEIGLFLGYPPQDVLDFIKFKGKNFCLCKYWKVYSNPTISQAKFAQIDEARHLAAKILNQEINFAQAISLLKTN